MANLLTVGITSGVPSSGTGTVSTIDNLLLQGIPISNGSTSLVVAITSAASATSSMNGLVVSISPNSVNANGQATMANSAPVTIASNQTPLAVSSTGAIVSISTAVTSIVAISSGPGGTPAAVKGSLTAASTTAPALTMTLSPNSVGLITLGQAVSSASVPITVGPVLLGSYGMGANTGTMTAALASSSPIFSFRYGGANLAIVRRIIAEADNVSSAFGAGAGLFNLYAARSFTVSDSSGTAATLTGNNGKLRTSFATTAISDLRIAATGTLTAGTRTLDAQPLASIETAVGLSTDASLLPTTDLFRSAIGESPLVLATNEGFVIQATVPGTGTWVASVRVFWDEVTAF